MDPAHARVFPAAVAAVLADAEIAATLFAGALKVHSIAAVARVEERSIEREIESPGEAETELKVKDPAHMAAGLTVIRIADSCTSTDRGKVPSTPHKTIDFGIARRDRELRANVTVK